MQKYLADLINGKKILLIGFGREGRSTYKLFSDIGTYSKLGIADINPADDMRKCIKKQNCIVHSGNRYLDFIDEYDIAVKSPGVVLPKSHREYICKITSQTEIFLEVYRKQVIGITGTKGKSTVAALLTHVLGHANVPCILAGNIGTPVLDILDDIRPETKIIFELSCHQLEMCKFSPAMAMLLNIYQDHLDHYKTFENYIQAKKNIYLHQESGEILYCGENAAPSQNETKAQVTVITKDVLPFGSLNDVPGLKLRGEHNLLNCAFVYIAAKHFGMTDAQFISSLPHFTPLPHRLEYIGTYEGADYYDDSISTTVESTISAVEGVDNAAVIILGGMDRGIDYTALVKYLAGSKLSYIICMYESGKRIYNMLKNIPGTHPQSASIIYCKDIIEATEKAKTVTPEGKACILSPASASYGDFKNFEERGDVYKKQIFIHSAC